MGAKAPAPCRDSVPLATGLLGRPSWVPADLCECLWSFILAPVQGLHSLLPESGVFLNSGCTQPLRGEFLQGTHTRDPLLQTNEVRIFEDKGLDIFL